MNLKITRERFLVWHILCTFISIFLQICFHPAWARSNLNVVLSTSDTQRNAYISKNKTTHDDRLL